MPRLPFHQPLFLLKRISARPGTTLGVLTLWFGAATSVRDVTHAAPLSIEPIWWSSSQECEDHSHLMMMLAEHVYEKQASDVRRTDVETENMAKSRGSRGSSLTQRHALSSFTERIPKLEERSINAHERRGGMSRRLCGVIGLLLTVHHQQLMRSGSFSIVVRFWHSCGDSARRKAQAPPHLFLPLQNVDRSSEKGGLFLAGQPAIFNRGCVSAEREG
ncbi:hypothetical protein Q8A73_001662 [Channa argus]|nr:hypothetical protein Q8A73_001662 [Channa argus]